MSERWNKASAGQQGDRPVFRQFNHDGFAGLAAAQVGDHAVGARIGAGEAALVAVDQQWRIGVGGKWIFEEVCHAHIMETGCDTPLRGLPKPRLTCSISWKSTGAHG